MRIGRYVLEFNVGLNWRQWGLGLSLLLYGHYYAFQFEMGPFGLWAEATTYVEKN